MNHGLTVPQDELETLSVPSDIRLGREIAERGRVEFTERNGYHAVAVVQADGGESRTVELRRDDKGLHWRCTCTKDRAHFCKHCVAAAVALG